MKINLKWLRDHNYDVKLEGDFIEIYPWNYQSAVDILQDQFGLERIYALFVDEEIQDFRVLMDIRKAK